MGCKKKIEKLFLGLNFYDIYVKLVQIHQRLLCYVFMQSLNLVLMLTCGSNNNFATKHRKAHQRAKAK